MSQLSDAVVDASADLPPSAFDGAASDGPLASDEGADDSVVDVDGVSSDGIGTEAVSADDAHGDVGSVDGSQDVTLVSDCETKPMMSILAEAKDAGILGYLYILGGEAYDPKDYPTGSLSAASLRLDLASGKWDSVASLPEVRVFPKAVWVANSIYLFSGGSYPVGSVSPDWPSQYPSICGKEYCGEVWRLGAGGSWTSPFDDEIPYPGQEYGVAVAGCSIVATRGSVSKLDSKDGSLVGQTGVLFEKYEYLDSYGAIAPWQDGFAAFAGVPEGVTESNSVVLLDAAGNPAGTTLPPPPCGIRKPRAWATATKLFVVEYGGKPGPAPDGCSGIVSGPMPIWQKLRPLAWDGKTWSAAPEFPFLNGGYTFVQTPVGVILTGTGTHKGKPLQSPDAVKGLYVLDEATFEWKDDAYPLIPISKVGSVGVWAPK